MTKFAIKLDPSTGPITREQFKRIVDAPFGAAGEMIRKYDPLWGLKPGEKMEWEVTVQRMQQGTVIVKAATEEEAQNMAGEVNESDVNWDSRDDEMEVVEVRLKK
jgi:hypothetical protein